jgi:hypothetical protein
MIGFINALYPIQCIKNKYNKISFNNELTQTHWNMYMMFLKNSPKSSFDMFDILIHQNMDKINFDITVAITRSEDKTLSYISFYNKLKKILGNAIDIKYRYTTNWCFVSILSDNGPYRRFRPYDII